MKEYDDEEVDAEEDQKGTRPSTDPASKIDPEAAATEETAVVETTFMTQFWRDESET